MLIGFSGKMGAGKTTAARMIKGAHIIPFAGAMKETIQKLFMFTDDQMYTLLGKNTIDPRWNISPREVMQKFSTDFIRTHYPTFWVDRMKVVLDYYSYRDIICIDDCRFSNEAELVRRSGGVIIHMKRPIEVQAGIPGHASEAGVEIMLGDETLSNDSSLDDLQRKMNRLIKRLAI